MGSFYCVYSQKKSRNTYGKNVYRFYTNIHSIVIIICYLKYLHIALINVFQRVIMLYFLMRINDETNLRFNISIPTIHK